MRSATRPSENPWTYVLLVTILIPFLFPLGWMFLSSLKTQVENTAYPPVWIFRPTLNNYRQVFIRNPFFSFTWNSLVVAAGSTGLALVFGLPGSYAIARFKRTGIALAILTARMAPGIGYLIPWFILFTKMKMIDTYTALILTHLIVALPLVLWVMIGFFEDVPGELIEAARIDGCSNFAAFLRVALPLVKPGIVATAILSFIFSWNNFLFSLIIAGFKTRTLPIAVYNFLSYEEINWGGLTAAATIITLPVLVLSLFIQKHIVRGLTFGALKG
ncbi:MAG TPA: carbohydrate ABC transporter permease [Candidatus Acidoferrum sp.]|nr:carbohydrate ABC transporter permease [Candidatus Methylomirabilis sp.]HWU37025.1 carbohydrate ABC transporter permease [Candidatus Acidoferrum sp.]